MTDLMNAAARAAVQGLRSSKIREIANAGLGRPDVLPFWFGEPDEPTPQYITRAAIEALEQGDTFYVQTQGLPALREAIARYLQRLHGQTMDVGRVSVTSSGTSGLMLALQAVVEPGDRVVAVTPLWPNLVEMPKVLGASVETFALRFDGGWRLDVENLLRALTPGTRALLINSPNNPTGWALSGAEQQVLLEHCRQRGIWIIADDVYERLYFPGGAAPSFLDIALPEDRLIISNSFSKAWRMTGWRLGWVVGPPQLHADLGKLIEINTTCSPPFIQRAAVAALEHGEEDIERSLKRLARSGAHLVEGLSRIPRVTPPQMPSGAMYLFFKVAGVEDSLAFCRDLVSTAGLGLAPGIAFGPDGEGYLRWCFASGTERIDAGLERLARHLR
jgi:aspartate/methionine/tyrosine aminotransferase